MQNLTIYTNLGIYMRLIGPIQSSCGPIAHLYSLLVPLDEAIMIKCYRYEKYRLNPNDAIALCL